MVQRRTVIDVTAKIAFGASVALVGACLCAGVASAQEDPWAIPGSAPNMKSGLNAAGSAAQKGSDGAKKAGSQAMQYTSYGVSHPGEVYDKSAKASVEGYNEASSGFMEAAESPLRDFNLMQRVIPASLVEAEKSPYDAHGLTSCKAIGDQVKLLDLALGPDVDTPNLEKIQDPYGRSAHFVANATLDAVKDVTTHIIPARNTIRRISGANRYDRNVRNAILAGAVRRGFLKAYGMMHECDWPAAPVGFAPVRAGDWTPEPGVQTTAVQTIAQGPMVVTVSTVSMPTAEAQPVLAPATAQVDSPASRPAPTASLGFAPSTQAGAWSIGRPVANRR